MVDIVNALELLLNRVNNEAYKLNIYDIGIISTAAQEINRNRKTIAVLDAELHKERP